MAERKCPICQQDISDRHHLTKYCSAKCTKIAKKMEKKRCINMS
jgi:endogenous inhibitor of DNA gyrase (YacG/DUF329 family)